MVIRDDFVKCETDVRLDGKVALVTGATAGIGFEVAKKLAKRGARVIIASRNPTKLEKAKNDIIHAAGHNNVVTGEIDYEQLSSVRNFARETIATEPRLDILVNNIGAVGLNDSLTEDGLQRMMQVNYFAPFLLTFLLFPLMKASAPSRIINVSSIAQLLGHIDVDRINNVGEYSNFIYYSNSKLANVLFTVEMDKRTKGKGVNVYSMDPGISKSMLFRNYDGVWENLLNSVLWIFGRPLDRVATMPVYLAVDPKLDNGSGKHYRDCAEFYSHWTANDSVLTSRLWKKTKVLLKITPQEDWEIRGKFFMN